MLGRGVAPPLLLLVPREGVAAAFRCAHGSRMAPTALPRPLQEHEKFVEAKKEEHFNAMLQVVRTTSRKTPHAAHAAGKVARMKVQPKKRDRRTIEEVQAVSVRRARDRCGRCGIRCMHAAVCGPATLTYVLCTGGARTGDAGGAGSFG